MMTKMAKKAMGIARGTALTLGVAVMVALVVGLASTALAGTGVGARFDLGKTNTVDAITKLLGAVAGPSLLVDNNSTGTGATALELQVESGKAPMKVNSSAKVVNLNADKIDGKDSKNFTPKTYEVVQEIVLEPTGSSDGGEARCDPGDVALAGGFFGSDADDSVITDSHGFRDPEAWFVGGQNNGTVGDSVGITVTCADFGAAHL